MNLIMKIKPSKKVSYTQKGALPSIRGVYGSSYTSTGAGVLCDENYIYAYNLEKHRKKSVRFGQNGKKLKKAKIAPKKWVCHYYRIPINVLKEMGLKVVQRRRNFTIESVK